jgi:methyl-accepting chemotaxis protein
MISLAQQIARGDLSHHVEAGRDARRKDEMGQLEEALTQMGATLRATIGHIQQAALRISTSSEQIAATLHQQAAISSQQAVATSQTTAATEELAATARQIAEAADQVVELAARNQEEAQRGVQAVSQTVEKMDEIEKGNEASLEEIMALSDRSRRIGEVMGFISGITDQTRLIAFNAAIEASAAGEIGRRFGVVATQVRELAGDVSRATEEIRERVGEIQVATNELAIASEQRGKRVAEGAEQTDVTAEVLEEILERANDVTEVAWQISLGTRQQQTAAEQAVDALREIATGAKQVEEGSQQTTRVVADLVTLAEELRQAVQHFQLPADEVALATEGSDARD